jgi:hypothetical protein
MSPGSPGGRFLLPRLTSGTSGTYGRRLSGEPPEAFALLDAAIEQAENPPAPESRTGLDEG